MDYKEGFKEGFIAGFEYGMEYFKKQSVWQQTDQSELPMLENNSDCPPANTSPEVP